MKLVLQYLIISEWNHTGWRREDEDFLLRVLKWSRRCSRGWSQKKMTLQDFGNLGLNWEGFVNEIKGGRQI